jgi:hypothetical protein
VLNEFLIPMSRNADYQSKVVMRKVETVQLLEMKDFRGSKTAHRQFAGDSGVRMVPTVMVFDSERQTAGQAGCGPGTMDYYGDYLDQAINKGTGQSARSESGGLSRLERGIRTSHPGPPITPLRNSRTT